MKVNMEQKKNTDQDERGNPLMTLRTINYYCSDDEDYNEIPEGNAKLYLNHKGFKKIESMEIFPNLVAVWFNNNGIPEISGLNSLSKLEYLYLNNNFISKISNLQGLDNLLLLNLAHNQIDKIQNLGCLPSLHTLILSQNFFQDKSSIQGLLQCKALTNLDLSKNQIENSDDIMKIFFDLPNMSTLNLKSTPLSKSCKFFRKKLTAVLKKLTFLDDTLVKEADHRLCEAWMKGGAELEQLQRQKIVSEKQEPQKAKESVQEQKKVEKKYVLNKQIMKKGNIEYGKEEGYETRLKPGCPIQCPYINEGSRKY